MKEDYDITQDAWVIENTHDAQGDQSKLSKALLAATAQRLAEETVAKELRQNAKISFGETIAYIDLNAPTLGEKEKRLKQDILVKQAVTNPNAEPLFVLKTLSFMAGLSFGLNESDAITGLLESEGHKTTFAENEEFKEISYNTSDNGYGVITTHLAPAVYHGIAVIEDGETKNISYMIPHLEYDQIKSYNLPHALGKTFVNAHEIGHTARPRDFSMHYSPAAQELSANSIAMQTAIDTIKEESYADLSGLGVLIDEGQELDCIEKIIEWRHKTTDLGHNTTAVLGEFKTAIMQCGLENFKRQTFLERSAFYEALIDQYAPNEEQLLLAMRVGQGQETFDIFEKTNNQKMASYATYFMSDDYKERIFRSQSSKTTVNHDFKADQELNNAAAKLGVITPTTRAMAFSLLVEERLQQAQHGGNTKKLNEEMLLLQTELLQGKPSYIQLNAKIGVDIFQQNTELATLKEQPYIQYLMEQKAKGGFVTQEVEVLPGFDRMEKTFVDDVLRETRKLGYGNRLDERITYYPAGNQERYEDYNKVLSYDEQGHLLSIEKPVTAHAGSHQEILDEKNAVLGKFLEKIQQQDALKHGFMKAVRATTGDAVASFIENKASALTGFNWKKPENNAELATRQVNAVAKNTGLIEHL